jgi:hypothetical protein
MGRRCKSEPIDIPEASREVKALFPSRESANAELSKIHEHMEREAKSYTFPGHTHTKPPKGAEPVYIGEFSMPKRLPKSKRLAPCPCCWDHFGKFESGMIAWFPDEKVIRLIGPDCFRALNPEGHDRAKRQYREEQEAEKDNAYLLSNLPKLPDAIEVIERAVIVAEAVEVFYTDLQKKLLAFDFALWPEVRDCGGAALKRSGR